MGKQQTKTNKRSFRRYYTVRYIIVYETKKKVEIITVQSRRRYIVWAISSAKSHCTIAAITSRMHRIDSENSYISQINR